MIMPKVIFKFAALMNPTEKYPNGYCKTVESILIKTIFHIIPDGLLDQ